jgi:hypothetical protein
VLTIDQVALCDTAKERVAEPPLPQAVQESRETRDPHRRDNATGLQHSPGLEQRADPLRLLGEMVQRAEHDDRVRGVIRLGNRAGIRQLRGKGMFGLGFGRLAACWTCWSSTSYRCTSYPRRAQMAA